MSPSLIDHLESILGLRPTRLSALAGGCIGEVYRLWLPDGSSLVAKVGDVQSASLDIEAYMLGYLKAHSSLPVPAVVYSSPTLLVMAFIEGNSHLSASVQRHAADLLADLHGIRGVSFGLERDTLIGGLHQPNSPSDVWIPFFRDHRLLYTGRMALEAGQLPNSVFGRLEHFCDQLDRWLEEPEYPSLIHGDMWTTNILAANGQVTGFLDPAIYYAHPEIELAFSTLFGTYGASFFERYHELRPISPGFFEARRDIYNLYPLLVHVRLFGGGYIGSVTNILAQFGC